MTPERLSAHLEALPGALGDQPFGPTVHVFKIAGRMFAILGRRNDRLAVSLKCDPFLSEILRAEHGCITPGYHLNKRHWITIEVDGSLGDDDILGLIEHSYERVKAKLSRAERAGLNEQKARSTE
jgi:predicted DNA-binding protein (MmcQ/YjbR family)